MIAIRGKKFLVLFEICTLKLSTLNSLRQSFKSGRPETTRKNNESWNPDCLPIQSVRAGTLNRYLSATLKERLRARGAPKLVIRSGHFLEVVSVDFSSAGRHQENFGRTSTKNAQAAQSANAH